MTRTGAVTRGSGRVALACALLYGGAVAAPATAAPPPAAPGGGEREDIVCDEKVDDRDPFYPGKSGSARYDGLFRQGARVPDSQLDAVTPQGVAVWYGWNGGRDLLVVSAYRDDPGPGVRARDEDARLIGIDAASGQHVGTLRIAPTHAGGIAIARGWAFVQGRRENGSETVRRYAPAKLREAFLKGVREGASEAFPFVAADGAAERVYSADFLSAYEGHLYAGQFNEADHDVMYTYAIKDDGTLGERGTRTEVPKKTQGALVTGDRFIYSTSYGRDKRSNIYVTRRGPVLDPGKLSCFRAPSMSEGLALYRGDVLALYESGAWKYRSDPKTRNVIAHLHMAPLSRLTALVG
ncbi:hypothetical protein GCM10010124_01450 [Pilimelia terevasa]|uniref:Uncharacterized protein n=1 Tax=Pilimelia terevasa TaxID=53372 RepID=A0A8J3BJ68_9ACTN|nr:hypothetical protein [Pilimelia terevasa]GGK12667.1 hypothetical protein GCM10010124_01450 [Pilimelia terevasa]